MIYGIDLSGWNALVDWKKVKETGKDFVFLKASEGLNYVSPVLQSQMEGTFHAGIIVAGIYHFARIGDDPARQGRILGERAKAIGVRPIMDVETQPAGMTWAATREWCRVAFDACDQAYGSQDCMFYSYLAYLRALGLTEEWAARSLWLAMYPKVPSPVPDPPIPAPWKAYTYYQYGGDANKATCPGVNGFCDLNVWPGTMEELATWCRLVP